MPVNVRPGLKGVTHAQETYKRNLHRVTFCVLFGASFWYTSCLSVCHLYYSIDLGLAEAMNFFAWPRDDPLTPEVNGTRCGRCSSWPSS